MDVLAQQWSHIFLYVTILICQVLRDSSVQGHGRLMDPPARNSMWRFGFATPVDYNDNELYCGGYAVQYQMNEGKCGVCGDPYNEEAPRLHEAGGRYARAIIGRYYSAGQDIEVEIELTANHKGTFVLKLCPNNNFKYEATQECFDRYPLQVSQTRRTRFDIPEDSKKKDIFRYRVKLPPYLTCSQCIIQWTYYTGNMWGRCDNGTESLGCGKPETFRNCADVKIVTSTGGLPPQFVNPKSGALTRGSDSIAPQLAFPLVIRSQVCIAHGPYAAIPGINEWCETNCLRFPPNCPASICTCPQECTAIGRIAGQPGADEYCQDKCLVYGGECPTDRCACY
ncbi:hypothetical protein M8J77_021439 [Diaphorina citri]|nr:hypothetical protein M8J77_021439 [Diaphorina citri]